MGSKGTYLGQTRGIRKEGRGKLARPVGHPIPSQTVTFFTRPPLNPAMPMRYRLSRFPAFPAPTLP